VKEGLALATDDYLYMRREIDHMRHDFFAAFPAADAFLCLAAPDGAPKGLAWTGDPKFISPWTALGGPIVTMPAGFTAGGLPIGCLIAGRPGSDRALVRAAPMLAADAGQPAKQ
jgi:aspartyl-tRNA(Asn)/glutamyl-tRNA(Gln) amidotransferase subunit A